MQICVDASVCDRCEWVCVHARHRLYTLVWLNGVDMSGVRGCTNASVDDTDLPCGDSGGVIVYTTDCIYKILKDMNINYLKIPMRDA